MRLPDEDNEINLEYHRGFTKARRERRHAYPWTRMPLLRWRIFHKNSGYELLPNGDLPILTKVKSNDFYFDHTHHGSTASDRPIYLIILFLLYAISNIFYILSLRGANTPTEMNGLLGVLGIFLVLSIVFFTAQFWTATIFLSLSLGLKAMNIILQLATLIFWYFLDHGNRLESHGSYNLLIFCVIFMPSNIMIGSLYLWYITIGAEKGNRPRRFCGQLLTASLVGAIIFLIAAKSKQKALSYGFFGNEIPCSYHEHSLGTCQSCQWQSTVPWLDLLPVRMNVFTGPMTCPQSGLFPASFSENGQLEIECDAALTEARSWFNGSTILSHKGAIYTTLPRTETLSLAFKGDSLELEENPLQKYVISFAEARLKPYEQPVLIDDNADTVLALCGTGAPKILNRLVPAIKSSGSSGIERVPQEDRNEGRLNVVTLFIDAVSRSQFHRRLPQTRQVLEGIASTEDSQSELFEFYRYHKVGFNTGPNTRALWAGLEEQHDDDVGEPLWEQYESAGYISARIDPMCQDWTAYYNPRHFPNSTSSHIDRPRFSHEYLSWSCFPPYLPVGKHNSGNFAGSTSIKARCTSGTHVGWHELDWAGEFIQKYQGLSQPFYVNAAFMEGHEGSGEVLRTLDERLARFFDPHTSPMDLNKTAVVIVSDHGALMGLNYAFFQNGRVEAANPAAIMLLPRWYTAKQDRSRYLGEAADKLVTAHDLYETMKAFKGADESSTDAQQTSLQQFGGRRHRGFNLLNESVGDRTCAEAGITETACKCH